MNSKHSYQGKTILLNYMYKELYEHSMHSVELTCSEIKVCLPCCFIDTCVSIANALELPVSNDLVECLSLVTSDDKFLGTLYIFVDFIATSWVSCLLPWKLLGYMDVLQRLWYQPETPIFPRRPYRQGFNTIRISVLDYSWYCTIFAFIVAHAVVC